MPDLINIAINKRACQSSTSRWSKPDESCAAINGDKGGEFSFHTDIETNAWWQVDLEAVFPLSLIVIFNRGILGSNFANRASSMEIYLSVNGMTWEKHYSGGQAFGGVQDNKPLRVNCAGKPARFVRLQLRERNYLHLDEVEVYTNNARTGSYAVGFPNTSPLVALGNRYGTDKVPHGFCEVYQQIFAAMRPRVTKILEIGVFFGASLCMWRDWFPNAVIHGADHFTGQQGNGRFFEDADRFLREVRTGQHQRIVLHQLDQSQRADLDRFAAENIHGTFDIIIDDASHLMRDQQQTLGILFSHVKPGGYFVIEDLHSSLGDDYDVEPDGSNSTLLMVENALAGFGWQSKYMTSQEMDFLNQAIDIRQSSVYGSGGSQTCILRRRLSSVPRQLSGIVPGSAVIVNYASMDELNQFRQQQNIVWARQWSQESISLSEGIITSADVVCFGPDVLDVDYYHRHQDTLSAKRGGGFWLWKPCVLEAMLAATNAEFLIYCDSGSTLTQPLDAIGVALRDSGASILVFDMTSSGRFEYQWTKGQVLRAMGATAPEFSQTGQICGTALALRVNNVSHLLVHEWLLLMQNPVFATDAPSTDGEGDYPGFVEHRHDQSILSILVKKMMSDSNLGSNAILIRDLNSWVGHHHISKQWNQQV
jgi:predicted O-methyltransferase YrrM